MTVFFQRFHSESYFSRHSVLRGGIINELVRDPDFQQLTQFFHDIAMPYQICVQIDNSTYSLSLSFQVGGYVNHRLDLLMRPPIYRI